VIAKGELIDSRRVSVLLPPPIAFQPIREIGGEVGWYYGNVLWRLRGLIDLVVGGPGPWRGRHSQRDLAPGDIVDAWRVEAFESDRLLLLKAEMKLPGQAWLRFDVEPTGSGSLIRQTAVFQPAGMAGRLYWYGLLPVHTVMFRGMVRAIAAEAQRRSQDGVT
jgi:uncharacterized protein DUF2867